MKSHAFLLFAALAGAQAQAQTAAGQTYTLGPFERLEIDGAANVRLTQGPQDQVFIAGDEGVQQSVNVTLTGNRLDIHPSGGWKFWNSRRMQIDVQMRTLSQINLAGATQLSAVGPIRVERLLIDISGAGSVRFDDLNAEQLRFAVSGAGDGELRGRVGELSLSISGKGKLQAEDLQATRASVNISGLGSAKVWVTDKLNIDVAGIGTVDYWGSPSVSKFTGGFSNITPRGDKKMP